MQPHSRHRLAKPPPPPGGTDALGRFGAVSPIAVLPSSDNELTIPSPTASTAPAEEQLSTARATSQDARAMCRG